jgi:hypothetical protein
MAAFHCISDGTCWLLQSVTIPFKNLIQYLSFYSFTPAESSSCPSFHPEFLLHHSFHPELTPQSKQPLHRSPYQVLALRSKTPDTYPDPNHQLRHNNDITALDPDPDSDLWLISDYLLVPDLLIHLYYSYAYWCSLSSLTDPLYIIKTHDSYTISSTASPVYKQAIGYLVSPSLIWLLPIPIAVCLHHLEDLSQFTHTLYPFKAIAYSLIPLISITALLWKTSTLFFSLSAGLGLHQISTIIKGYD